MTEAFLHYIWQHRMLPDGLVTTDGRPVVVLNSGAHNGNAGPDFFGAHIVVEGVEWVGNVEIHIHTSDWTLHHHSDDEAYNNVILHVVYEHNCEIILQNGRKPATIELSKWINPALVECYDTLTAPSDDCHMPCAKKISGIPKMLVTSFLERLAAERIESKAEKVDCLLKESNGGWEQTCYRMVARYFGGKVNSLPFDLLVKATDQRLLARWRDNPQRVEALLMGQAGLLEGYFEDEYPRALQADYEAIRNGADLHPIDGYLWKFFKMRPSSFPTVRISQFANLVCRSTGLFSKLLQTDKADEIVNLFMVDATPYWDTHYRFDAVSARKSKKKIGRMQAESLLINAWVPLLYHYGTVYGQQEYQDRALSLLMQISAEDNVVTRRWQETGIDVANAADSQALLQLEQHYCSGRRCLECRIGYRILKNEKTTI